MPQNTAPHPNVTAKKPPQNNEAEQAVLGCVMIAENAALGVLPVLKADDFYLKAHRMIFAAMKSLFDEQRPVDIVTVLQELDKRGQSDETGGLEYISSLTNAIPTAANYKHYCDIVRQNSLRRQLIFTAELIGAESYKGENEDVLTFAESKIFQLGESAGRRDLTPVKEAVAAAYQKMDDICRDKAAFRGVPSGFDLLDGYLNGFQGGDLIVLAARPGHGKTSLGMNFVVNAALAKIEKIPGVPSKLCCAVFSLEMPAEQLAKRMLCSVAKVSMANASNGNLTDAEWGRLRQKKPVLDKAEIYIDDTSAITPAEIISKCRQLKRKSKLDLVMIDYLQLMSAGKKTDNRQQEISEITRAMKIAAKELNVPILLLSQLSRKTEERKDKQPLMSDLRESGAIEQDADIVLFIYDPGEAEASKAGESSDIRKLIIAKHRNGETGNIDLKWRGEYVTFENHGDKPAALTANKQKAAEPILPETDGGDLPF